MVSLVNVCTSVILDAVRTALVYDPRIDSTDTTVAVTGGIVTLRGKVDSVRAQRAAAETARNTVGVISVTSFIRLADGLATKPRPPATPEFPAGAAGSPASHTGQGAATCRSRTPAGSAAYR